MNHDGPGSPRVEELKTAAGSLTLSSVEARLRKRAPLSFDEALYAELAGWEVKELDAKEWSDAVYGAVVAIDRNGLSTEFARAFDDLLSSFRSSGRRSPSGGISRLSLDAVYVALAEERGHPLVTDDRTIVTIADGLARPLGGDSTRDR